MGILESERLVTINVNLLQDKFSAFNYHIGIIRKLAILRSSPSYIRHHLVYTHCMKKRIYVLRKICEKGRKDHIFVSFHMFPFHGNIVFSELFFKKKCKKAASLRKCVFFRKYEIFVYDSYVVL